MFPSFPQEIYKVTVTNTYYPCSLPKCRIFEPYLMFDKLILYLGEILYKLILMLSSKKFM